MISVLIAVAVLVVLGVVFGIGLAMAARFFHVETDPRVDAVWEALPHIDCGACGFPGCRGYAEAVVKGEIGPNECKPGGPDVAAEVARIMGLEHCASVREVVILKCKGRNVGFRHDYAGVPTCRAAALVQNSPKLCQYGCIGFGDCAKVCPTGAIVMEDNFPRVIEEKCLACGACVKACPKMLYVLRPVNKTVHVLCSSHDKGGVVMKVCGVGCIGCKKCEKVCPVDAIHVTDNLADIDMEKCKNCALCIKECPTKVIENFRAQRRPAKKAPAKAAEPVAAEA